MIRPYVPILSVCHSTPEIAITTGGRVCDPDLYEVCFRSLGCYDPPLVITATTTAYGCGCPPSSEPPPPPPPPQPDCLVRYKPLYANDDNELVFRVDDALLSLPPGRYRAVVFYVGEECPVVIGDVQVDLCHNRPRHLAAKTIQTINCC